MCGQVEIGVLRQVDDRGLVGFRGVIHAQLVIIRQRIGDIHGQITGIAFLAVFAQVGQFEPGPVPADIGPDDFPDDLVKAFETAMQRVGRVVRGERVGHAIQRKPALCDAIAIAPGERAEKRAVLHIPVERVIPQNDIVEVAVRIGHFERRDNAAVGHDAGFRALDVVQGVALDRLPVRCRAKGLVSDLVHPPVLSRGATDEGGGGNARGEVKDPLGLVVHV